MIKVLLLESICSVLASREIYQAILWTNALLDMPISTKIYPIMVYEKLKTPNSYRCESMIPNQWFCIQQATIKVTQYRGMTYCEKLQVARCDMCFNDDVSAYVSALLDS